MVSSHPDQRCLYSERDGSGVSYPNLVEFEYYVNIKTFKWTEVVYWWRGSSSRFRDFKWKKEKKEKKKPLAMKHFNHFHFRYEQTRTQRGEMSIIVIQPARGGARTQAPLGFPVPCKVSITRTSVHRDKHSTQRIAEIKCKIAHLKAESSWSSFWVKLQILKRLS